MAEWSNPLPPIAPSEEMSVLIYLRDHNYIQGVDAISKDELPRTLGWNTLKLRLVLEHFCDSGWVGFKLEDEVFITPLGIKILMHVN